MWYSRLRAAAAALAILALVASACGQSQPSSAPDPDDPGIGHVHGLGVDPADGMLYAATHYGLFRVPEKGGRATRIADRFQDTMGFTVTGPNRFLASGHPDFQDKELFPEGDPHLGLIQSTDAGETWKPLSLFGEADFHALVAAHDRTYGYSSTDRTFMVSADGKTWDRRSQIDLVSFAVDLDDPEYIVGISEGWEPGADLVISSDGGRRWRPQASPELGYLSWDEEGGLWGAGSDGAVHRSVDKGARWEHQGSLPGTPEAFLVHGQVLYAAVSEEGIFHSTDGGRTWQLRYRDP